MCIPARAAFLPYVICTRRQRLRLLSFFFFFFFFFFVFIFFFKKSERERKTKNKKQKATTTITKTKPQQRKRNTKETRKKKLSDNTVNRRRPGRKTTQPEGCIPTPEGDGAALEEVSGCISRRDTKALA